MARLRDAVGLRTLGAGQAAGKGAGKKAAAKDARFVSFRDTDGSFRFRLLAADGEELLLSDRHADPKEAGALMRRLADAQLREQDGGVEILLDGAVVARGPGQADKVRQALASLRQE